MADVLMNVPVQRVRTGLLRHRVWLTSGAVLAAVWMWDATQGATSTRFVVEALLGTAPFLILSIALAAYAAATGADNLIARAFSGAPARMVLFAALVGALSPFCSCGVIPLVAALLGMGVPLSAVMAFWLASPIMDPSMFVLTTGVLGLEFALAKTVAAIGLGLVGGYAVMAMTRMGGLTHALRDGVGMGCCSARSATAPQPVVWRFWQEDDRVARFRREALATMLFLLKWLTLAFVLESLMLAYVPAGAVSSVLGGEGPMAIILASTLGVPAYLNGYAALPLVGELLSQGMAPGAALAFLIAGGVSSVPAAIAVWALARPPVFLLYLALAFGGAMVSGFAYALWV